MSEAVSSPLISVVMSVYNGQQFLREAVDSVLSQTMGDFEFIIVNDGSTDTTLSILQSYKDSRLKIINLSSNVGLVKALNIAIYESRGYLLARMDADDVCAPDRFNLQEKKFSENNKLVLLGSAFEYIDELGNPIKVNSYPCNDGALQELLIKPVNPFNHPSVMMRKADVLALKGYREEVNRYAQDYDLFLRLAERGVIQNLPQALIKYRIHSDQITIKKMKPQLFSVLVYQELAFQRRTGNIENLKSAIEKVNNRKVELKSFLVAGYLYWADLFGHKFFQNNVNKLLWNAILIAPLNIVVHNRIKYHLKCKIKKLFNLH